MPFGRSILHDTEEELPESDDELIMSVLNDLGIQERPDVEASHSSYLDVTESADSSYLEVAESPLKRCSVAFSEASDGWTIASRKSATERLKSAATEKQQLKEQVKFLRQEVQRLRGSNASPLLLGVTQLWLTSEAGIITEQKQEKAQIKDLKHKLQESQTRVERWQKSCRHLRLENQRLLSVRSGLEQQSKWIESQIDSLVHENFDTFDIPDEFDISSFLPSSVSMVSPSSSSIAHSSSGAIR